MVQLQKVIFAAFLNIRKVCDPMKKQWMITNIGITRTD